MTTRKEQIAVRKALLQERMTAQRGLLKPRLKSVVKTGQRFAHLFDPPASSDGQSGRNIMVTIVALTLATLGKKRAGWLGAGARYLIVHYPGLLRKFTKK